MIRTTSGRISPGAAFVCGHPIVPAHAFFPVAARVDLPIRFFRAKKIRLVQNSSRVTCVSDEWLFPPEKNQARGFSHTPTDARSPHGVAECPDTPFETCSEHPFDHPLPSRWVMYGLTMMPVSGHTEPMFAMPRHAAKS